MECSRIPAADLWGDFPQPQQDQFRNHIEYCSNCRAKFLREAPDKLLFLIEEPEMPEQFWLGFWNSLHAKIRFPQTNRVTFPVLRWTAVIVLGLVLGVYSHHLPKPALQAVSSRPVIPDTFQHPLVEQVQNPKATYYIFQAGGNEKIVMIVDPDLEF